MIGQTKGFVQTTLFAPPPEPKSPTSTHEVAPATQTSSASDSLSSGGTSVTAITGRGTSAKDTSVRSGEAGSARAKQDAASTGAVPRSLSGPQPAFVVSQLEATLSEQALRLNGEEVREATPERQAIDNISSAVEDLAKDKDIQLGPKTDLKAAETKDATNGFSEANRLSEPYQNGTLDAKT